MNTQARLRTFLFLALTAPTLAACGPRLLGASATAAPSAVQTVTVHSTVTQLAALTAHTAGAVPATANTGAAQATSSSATTTGSKTTVAVYFTQGSHIVSEPHAVPAASPARGSIDALLAGPSAAGHYSQVPTGTKLLSLNLTAGTATVNLSSQAANLEGSPAIPLFLAQIVETLTQFPDVQHVVIEVNGRPLRSLGGEGAAVPEPLDKATVQKMLAGNP